MLIKLTEDHIKRGKSRNAHCCPVALALRDALDMDDVAVTDEMLRIESCYYTYSRGVKKWIQSFDYQLETVKPKTLKLTDETLTFSNKRNFDLEKLEV